jgi:hypothetical protein
VETSPGYRLLQLDPYFHFNEYFDSIPGVIDSDMYHDTNPVLIIKKEGQFVIKRGTPLTVFVPIKRENISGECMPFDQGKFRLLSARDQFVARSRFSALTTYKEEQRKVISCPFHKEP